MWLWLWPNIDMDGTTSSLRRRASATAHFAPHPYCSLQIKKYEKLETDEERIGKAREIYDFYIMRDLLSHSHVRRSRFLARL